MPKPLVDKAEFPPSEQWFTEVHEEAGTAFSFGLVEKLHAEQSPFQKIEIYETSGFGTLMVIDGFVMLTDRDNFLYHEMMAHPAIFTHPDPKQVVIIGGGDCGTLREVLKHDSVERAIQIDIDERVTRLAEKYFPQLCDSNDDSRASLHFADGIQWMREQAADSVDVIIVDSTDPVGPAEGLFNVDFYRNCYRALSDGGILVQQSESPLLHLELLQAIHKGMRDAQFEMTKSLQFPQPVYPSGWWSATLARKGKFSENAFYDFRRCASLPFTSEYYTSDIHAAALVMPPFFTRALEKT